MSFDIFSFFLLDNKYRSLFECITNDINNIFEEYYYISKLELLDMIYINLSYLSNYGIITVNDKNKYTSVFKLDYKIGKIFLK